MTTTRITLEFKNFGPALRRLGAKLDRAMVRGLRDAGNILRAEVDVQIAKTEVDGQVRPPVATAAYRAAWTKTPTDHGAQVGNPLPYAELIERGRRPGPVGAAGLRALIAWVKIKGLHLGLVEQKMDAVRARRAKGGTVGLTASGRARSVKADAEDDPAYEISRAIALHIEEHGTKPRWVMKRAIEAASERMMRAIETSLAEVAP